MEHLSLQDPEMTSESSPQATLNQPLAPLPKLNYAYDILSDEFKLYIQNRLKAGVGCILKEGVLCFECGPKIYKFDKNAVLLGKRIEGGSSKWQYVLTEYEFNVKCFRAVQEKQPTSIEFDHLWSKEVFSFIYDMNGVTEDDFLTWVWNNQQELQVGLDENWAEGWLKHECAKDV